MINILFWITTGHHRARCQSGVEKFNTQLWPPVSAVHPSWECSHRSASLTPYFTDTSTAETSPKPHFPVSKIRITDNIQYSLSFFEAQHQCILALPSTLNIMTVHLENRTKSCYCCTTQSTTKGQQNKDKREKSLGRKSKAPQT